MGRLSIRGLSLAALFLLVTATSTFAQSAISGLVRDTSGAVMPGVTVEASSPVLIEKVRTVVTDDQGRYAIVDLRPGVYTIAFTLAGFNTYRQDALELPSNFTATVNAEMRVGALEESVTVTGATPVVDVQNVQRAQVLNREILDAVPSARSYSGLAALMPGVRMSNTDVGGNQQAEQIYMTVNGSRQTDITVQNDGLKMNSIMSDGQVQAYYSDAAQAEITYQTSGITAEVSGGGVRINMIPKDGGNTFSGQIFTGGSNGAWQSDNVNDRLRTAGLGLTQGSRIAQVSDINFGLGGPIKRDKLWFFASWRRIATDTVIANSYWADPNRTDPRGEAQSVQNQMVRLTWQINQKNKLSVMHDRYPKFKRNEVIAGWIAEWATASGRRDQDHALYYTGQVKWAATLSNRLLLEAGYSTNVEYLYIGYQPGVQKERGTTSWFNTIGKEDLATLRVWDGRRTPANGIDPKAKNLSAMMSFVTGSHQFKTGFQWGFGDYVLEYDINGDLVQIYRNGAPDSVRVYNTPIRANEFLNRDLGMFVQDAWTLKRMTVNAGVRFESFNARIKPQLSGAGRFAPDRTFSQTENLPNWFDITPRLGMSYDLFGNARTAVKASVGRYMAGQALGFPQRYNPLQLQSDTRSWRDLNGDNIAQDNEIGASNNRLFGLPVFTIRPDENIQREYDIEYTAQVQHEVVRGFSANIGYYRRTTHDQRVSRNTGFTPADYTIINVVSPLDGAVIPLYNIDPAKRALAERIDFTSDDSSLRRRTYNGVQLGFNARVGGAQFFGGWTFDRVVDVRCDAIESNFARYGGSALIAANNLPQPDFHFCDQSRLNMPWLHELKFAGSYTLPWYGIQTNVAFQSYNGQPLFTRWNIGPTTRYAANCTGPCRPGDLVAPNLTLPQYVVDLVAPGTAYYPRMNQLDFGVRKIFRIGKYQLSGQFDLFNAMNSAFVKSQNITFGTNAFGTPLDILNPRLLRLAAQLRF
jgi:Carboxypeptidase regulatory-like domain